MPDIDDDIDDEIAWEEWLEMSDAEHDAVMAREVKRYNALLARMTLKQRIAFHRRNYLKSCLDNRARLKNPNWMRIDCLKEMATEHLRNTQMRLFKLRVWRATGFEPGAVQ